MEQTVKIWSPFSQLDYLDEENWLQEQARNGLLLIERTPLFSIFKKSDPCEARYRILLKGHIDMQDDELTLYEASGWDYIKTSGKRSVFVTLSSDTTELFTDNNSYLHYLKRFLRFAWLEMLCALLLIPIWGYNFFITKNDVGLVHTLVDNPRGLGLLVILSYAIIVWSCIDNIVKRFRFLRELKEKGIIRTYDPQLAQKKLRNNRKASVVLAMCFVILIGGMLYTLQTDNSMQTYYNKDALNVDNSELVMFQTIDPLRWDELYPIIQETTEEDFWNWNDDQEKIEYQVSMANPNAYVNTQTVESLNTYLGSSTSEEDNIRNEESYYEEFLSFRNSWLANKYITEEIKRNLKFQNNDTSVKSFMESIKTSCEGVDYLGYYKQDENYRYPSQFLYVRKDNLLFIVSYVGQVDLSEKEGLYIQKLQDSVKEVSQNG